jgi:hypothetical protein
MKMVYMWRLIHGMFTRAIHCFQEYVKGISSTGMQSNCGFEGQVNACWTHKMSTKELDTIHSAGFLISVIHGRLVFLQWINSDLTEFYASISPDLHKL